MSNYNIPQLPLPLDIETKAILKKTAAARSALAEMKGAALSIPNESILISTLSLQEAKDSSAIEKIGSRIENDQNLHMTKPSCKANRTFLYMTKTKLKSNGHTKF